MKKTILVLAANPKDTPRLRLDKEIREIKSSLERADKRKEFIIELQLAAQPEDVRRAMLRLRDHPGFVHFCGHGGGADGIALEDSNGQTQLVSAEALSGLFKLFADTVECVVLNACYSEIQAQAIAQHINYVVGMKEGIGDDAAIAFAGAFYDALGAGRSIKFAYELACSAIPMAGIPGDLIPILRTKTDPSSSLPVNRGVSTEGVIISVALDIHDHQLPQTVQLIKDIVGISYELIGCRNDRISLFLPRHEQQPWGNLSSLSLQKAFHIALKLKQVAIALHIEHDGCCLGPGLIIGKEIDFANSMLPSPLRPHIFLSSEVYGYLSQYLSDSGSVQNLLPHTLQKKKISPEIIKLTTVLHGKSASVVDDELREVYNLCLKSESGELILGDMTVPPDRFRVDHCRRDDKQTFIERLVNADRVCIVGITNENLGQYLKQSLQKRKELGRGFWDELHVIFLAHELLSSVLDYRCTKFDLPQAIEDRYLGWGRGLREVREFLLGCGSDVSTRWECLQFNYMLPFEAQRYIDKDGNSLIQLIPILPNSDIQEGYFIEASNGFFLFTQFSNAIDAIVRTATPIVEFNVYGHTDEHTKEFILGGVVSQREWREFKPPEGGRACFPVVLILLHLDTGGIQRVFLQKRTIFNTGGDLDVFSLISGKVNDEDFFPDVPKPVYRELVYQVNSSSDDNMRQKLSKEFAKDGQLRLGQPVLQTIMKDVWKRTAIRELNSELGLQIKPDRLIDVHCPPLLRRGEFDLYVNLYTLELQPEELTHIRRVRPNANLEPFSLDKLEEYNDANPTKLNHFLNVHFDDYIVPLVRDTLGVK